MTPSCKTVSNTWPCFLKLYPKDSSESLKALQLYGSSSFFWMWMVVRIWHTSGELDTRYTFSLCRVLTGMLVTLFLPHLVNLVCSVCSVWKQWYKEGLNNNSVFQFYRLTNCSQEIKTYIFPLRLRNPTCMLQCAEGAAESILCKHFFHLWHQETLAQQSRVSQGLA